jgi:3'-5' exoribonuclease
MEWREADSFAETGRTAMIKQQYADTLKPGQQIKDIFAVARRNLSQKKNGDHYLRFRFADRTGEVEGIAWDDVDTLSAASESCAFACIEGAVSEYRGSLQITVNKITPCDTRDIDPSDFLPTTQRDPDRMFERLQETIRNNVKDRYLLRLMDAFWSDSKFVSRFKRAPAAKMMHHAYIGGLLEHTLSMTVLIRKIAEHYSGINMDILLTGAILHDIGKTREFEYEHRIDYSDEGRLVSHIVIGCGMLEEKIREIEGFPQETAVLLKHMIVSHHGSREFGSPEPPKTLEAVLLNQIDDIDAKMNGLRTFIAKETSENTWTSKNWMLGRPLYTGGKERLG